MDLEFAAEFPIYADLKTVAQAVALAKWMKAQAVPVDWNAIGVLVGEPFPTPETTPAARDTVGRPWLPEN